MKKLVERELIVYGYVYYGLYVDARGRSGGLALLRESTVFVSLLSMSLHHIDAEVAWHADDSHWRFTGLYGWHENHLKTMTCDLVNVLKNDSSLPWLVGGDYNEIFCHHEKRGDPLSLKMC